MAVLNNPLIFGVLFGFVPAMGLLYWILGRYEGFFDEKRVFKYLLVGLVAGAGLLFLEEMVLRFDLLADPAWALLLFVLGYSVLETLAKAAILNWRSLRGRRDAPFYSASFGLGLAAGMALAIVTQRAVTALAVGGALGTVATWVFFAILLQLTIGSLLIHASTAVLVGKGVAEDLLIVWGLRAALATLPIHAAEYLIYHTPWAGSIILPTLVLAYGIGLTVWTIRKVLDTIVPPEVARAAGLERRRRGRRAAAGAETETERPGDAGATEGAGGPAASPSDTGETRQP